MFLASCCCWLADSLPPLVEGFPLELKCSHGCLVDWSGSILLALSGTAPLALSPGDLALPHCLLDPREGASRRHRPRPGRQRELSPGPATAVCSTTCRAGPPPSHVGPGARAHAHSDSGLGQGPRQSWVLVPDANPVQGHDFKKKEKEGLCFAGEGGTRETPVPGLCFCPSAGAGAAKEATPRLHSRGPLLESGFTCGRRSLLRSSGASPSLGDCSYGGRVLRDR